MAGAYGAGRRTGGDGLSVGGVGGIHHHDEPEFSSVLEGSMLSHGVLMEAGHASGAQAGTTHDGFRTEIGCTLLRVFKVPG